MKKSLLLICSAFCFLSLLNNAFAQTCSGIVSNGQNLVVNGDFSSGYTGWTHDPLYTNFTPCGSSCYSVPGKIYAGSDEQSFNQAFANQSDHSSSSDDMYLMVDGICQTGVNLWSQSGIPIQPNTNYYFTVWVASLKNNPTNPGTLRFDINGTPLGTIISAPGTLGSWVSFTAVWNSGLTPPATATISIQNTTTSGCQTEVDFAIDDISFTPGCEFGSAGPTPDLGPDFSICGRTLPFDINPNFNAATSARPDITYTWYKDGVQQTSGMGASFYSYSVSAPGTYAVCVDSAGNCPKTDILVITNNYSVDLGPDLTLCNPTTAFLDAGYTGPGVTYQWYNGGAPISGATGKTHSVTNSGTYSVTVNDPSCGVQADNITITSDAATPNDGAFCPIATGGTGIADLSVTGPGKYKWWDAPAGGTALATGPAYTTPVLPGPGPYTYYVEDTSTFALTLGSPVAGHGFSNVTNMTANDSKNLLVFNALTSFRLDSITVLPYNYYCPTPATGNPNVVNIIIYDALGAVVGTSSYSGQCTTTGQPAAAMKVPVGIDIPEGSGYQMRLNTGSTNIALYLNTTGGGGNPPSPELYHYPTSYSSAVEFVSNSSQDFNAYYSPNAYPGYFDWKITKGINCQRVPVTAYQDCPDCITSTPASSASVTPDTYCVGSGVATVTLSVSNDGSGDELVWYTGSAGGTEIARNSNDNDVVVAAPSSPTTYFARWESADGCNSRSVSTTVVPVNPPSASAPNTIPDVCNTASVNLSGNTPSSGTGMWSKVSGTGTITDPFSATSSVTGIGVGDLVVSWTISNSPCASNSSQITIHRDTLSTPAILGSLSDTCALTMGVVFSTTTDHTPNTTYNWTSIGTLNIASQSGNSVTVDIGAAGGTLQVTETNGECVLSASRSIGISPTVSAANAGTDQTPCINTSTLSASAPLVGSGQWTVSSGTGIFADSNDPKTVVSGLSLGSNVFTWTVSGCGGPVSDNVLVNFNSSNLVVNAFGPSDTLCIGTPRELRASATGGSGNYSYVWTSSDNSFSNNSNDAVVFIKPENTVTSYYVYAIDNVNSTCISNTDSVKVSALFNQNLIFNNLMTPNKDGLNDEFIARDALTLQSVLPGSKLEVYNKWGGKVYRSDNYDNTWNASGLTDGIYYYNFQSGCGASVHKGWLHIISNTNQ